MPKSWSLDDGKIWTLKIYEKISKWISTEKVIQKKAFFIDKRYIIYRKALQVQFWIKKLNEKDEYDFPDSNMYVYFFFYFWSSIVVIIDSLKGSWPLTRS